MSNAGQVILAVVGTVVGAYFGYPMLGFELGLALGTLVSPTKLPPTYGPRLSDHNTTTSNMGDPIPLGWGTFAVNGTVIWLDQIVEHQQSQDTGGKGGAQQTNTTFTYTQSIAVGLHYGEIINIPRIWENGTLVFDTTAQRDNESDADHQKRLAANTLYEGTFVLHKGSESQGVDSTISAVQGVDSTPPWLGLAYIVYPNRLLKDNQALRHPQWKFEIVTGGEAQQLVIAPTFLPAAPTGVHNFVLAVDWIRGRYYTLNPGNNAVSPIVYPSIQMWDINTNTELLDYSLTNYVDPVGPGSSAIIGGGHQLYLDEITGYLFLTYNIGDSYGPFLKLDPVTLHMVACTDITTSYASCSQVLFGQTTDYQNAVINLAFMSGEFFKMFVILVGLDNMPSTAVEYEGFRYDSYGNQILLFYGVPEQKHIVWWVAVWNSSFLADSTPITLHKIVYVPPINPLVDATFNSTLTWSIHAIDIDSAWDHILQCGHFQLDNTDGSLIFSAETSGSGGIPNGSYRIKYNLTTGAIVWKHANQQGDGSGQPVGLDNGVIAGGELLIPADSGVYTVDTNDGTAAHTDLAAQLAGKGAGSFTTWSASPPSGDAVIVVTTNGPFVIFLAKPTTGDVLVSRIVHEICNMATLTENDVSKMDDTTVHGYVLQTPTVTARDAITPLQVIAFFDGVENGEKFTFVTRGADPVLTLTQNDLGAYEAGSSDDPDADNTSIDTLESALPMQVKLQYVSSDKDYQVGMQLSPARYDTDATQIANTQVAVVLDDDHAARVVEIVWNQAWQRRRSYNFALDMGHSDLIATDALLVPMKNTLVRVMIAQIVDSSQILRKITAVSDDDGIYVSSAVAAPVPIQTTMKFSADSLLQMLDTPLLRDADDTNRISAPLYSAVGKASADTWTSANILASADGISYNSEATATTPADMGYATSVMPDTTNPFVTDTASSLHVKFDDAAVLPTSITDADMLSGGNAMALVDPTGQVEIIQFRDVAINSGQNVTLSHFFRGRRGTDTMTASHAINSRVVLLNKVDVEVTNLSLSQVDKSLYWKAVSAGSTLDSGTPVQFESVGRSLMPYAPVNLLAFVDPVGTIFITAKRRARIGKPDWLDQENDSSPQLAEDYEEYSMDVYSGASIVRTLSSTSLPVIYPSDEVVSDFTTVPSSIKVALYQLSAEVGRGFARIVTLTVNPTSQYAPLKITSVSLPEATVGSDYSFTFKATGGVPPYIWTLASALPNTGKWMAIDPITGVLDGIPAANETENLTLEVADKVGAANAASYSIVVTGGSSSGGSTGGGSTGGGTGGTGGGSSGGTAGGGYPGFVNGAPTAGGMFQGGDQSFGEAAYISFTDYETAPPGTDVYDDMQICMRYDVLFGFCAGFDVWEVGGRGRTKKSLVNTVKHGGKYPCAINASRIPLVFAYVIIESALNVSSGSGYQPWVNVVRAKGWWTFTGPAGSGSILGGSGPPYVEVNYGIAWPVGIASALKDTTIAGKNYSSLQDGMGPAEIAALYFGSGLLVESGNSHLYPLFNALTNGASADFDGLYLDNAFTFPNGGGNLSNATASWDGIGSQTNATIGAYPKGAGSLLSRGQYKFFMKLDSYLAVCNPGKKYYHIGNFGDYFNQSSYGDVGLATANATAGFWHGGTIESAFGSGGPSFQMYKTFDQMRDDYYKWMDYCIEPKIVGICIRLPAIDGSQTATWRINGVSTVVTTGSAQEYQCWRAGLCFTLLENGIPTPVVHLYNWRYSRWYDELGADDLVQCNVHRGYMGNRIGARPAAAAFSNGLWIVEYDNAIAIFNPWLNGQQTLTASMLASRFPGITFICIQGTQQPSINTGVNFVSHVFGDPDGLILLKKQSLKFVATTLDPGSVGVAYSTSVADFVSGAKLPVTFSAVSAKPNTGSWIHVSATGMVTGTPGTAETESVAIKVVDATGTSVTTTMTIVVS